MSTELTRKDFVKDILQRYGLMMLREKDNTNQYSFISMNDLLGDRTNSIDWTSKLIKLGKESYSSGYAQNNKADYSYASGVVPHLTGNLVVNNDNSEHQKTIITAPYEVPELPDVILLTHENAPEKCVKTLIERIGDFSLGYPISSDREFMLRVVLAGVRDHELGMLSYAYRRHPGSLTMDTEKSNRGPIAIEHMNMALDFMRQVNSPDMIKCLRHWHTREAYKLIRVYLAKIKIGYAFSVLVTALKIDPWWFLRAAALRPYKTYMKLVKIIR